MEKILLIGNAPLPYENVQSRPAAGLRTFQFLKPLIDRPEKFKVLAAKIAMPECYSVEVLEKEVKHGENFAEVLISKNNPDLVRNIQRIHDEFNPDAIVGVNTYPSYIVSLLKSDKPFWADLNGWIMAEAQAQAFRMESNDFLAHYFGFEKNILKRADRLSTVSHAQQFAIYGELGTLGRLNKENFGHGFLHHIPNGTQYFEGEEFLDESLREFKEIPDDVFVALWIGGYNTWVDERTLFQALEAAMERCADFYFVSTGGEVAGLDSKTFKNFQKLIDESKFRDRFIFLGWVNTNGIPYLYRRANVGLNVDRNCLETLTGARNRIIEMMKFGLPVITTLGSEISFEVERVKAGIGVKSGDYLALAEALAEAYELWNGGGERERRELHEFSKNGIRYVMEECNYEKIMKPWIEWAGEPVKSSRELVNLKSSGMNFISSGFRYLRMNGLKKSWNKLWQKIKF